MKHQLKISDLRFQIGGKATLQLLISNLKFDRIPSRAIALRLVWVMLLLGVAACQGEGQTAKKLAQDSAVAQKLESSLTFNDVTLEQTDEQGNLLWKVKANKAVYTNDKKTAQIYNPTGDLLQDGKVVYQVSAQQGEVQKNGKTIFLKGQIVATDTQTGAVLRGNELEWRPKEDLLIVRNQVTGTHKKLQASAQEGRAFSRAKRIELNGQVIAKAIDPPLQMRTEHLVWQMQQEKVIGDRPIQIDRYKDKVITDRAFGNQAEVDLKTKIATLKQNARLALQDPPLDIASNVIVWNVGAETVASDQPVQVFERQNQLQVTANRGRVDLKPKIAYLNGNIRGVELRRKSQVYADQMTWTLATQVIEATGNVVYRQIDPPMNLTGPKAVGRLQDQTVVVSSGNGTRVVTEIIP